MWAPGPSDAEVAIGVAISVLCCGATVIVIAVLVVAVIATMKRKS